ncbi:MAG: shikimate dehydrogenase [Planctomycetales bacterium]|nr:shikimate dehydrogenase [Planctomycetales bacterium]
MICVSIGRGRHRHLIAEHKHLVEKGAKLVELRLDYINRDVNLKRLLQDRPCDVIITCRRLNDGGKWKKGENERIMLLRSAIAEGVEYVDLEEDIAGDIPRYGATKRIVSLHDFEKTPQNLEAVHARLCKLDADIVKIATMANNPHDNVRMLELIANAKVPTVGLCMGEIGTPSRILAGRVGAPFTYATFHHERSLAPGQLSFQVMQDVYNYDNINAETEVYGVIADPVGHSFSPLVHNAAFRKMGLNMVYLPFRVPAENLDQFIKDCPTLGIRGLSVTIPHKESIMRHCTRIDGAAKGIGAVNTLVIQGDQRLGFNTDYKAAMAVLDAKLGTAERSTPLAGHTALILGAGGAARALAFGLTRRGADVVIAGRTRSRADALAKSLECRSVEWEHRHKVKADVIVNATPIGMHPNVDETPFDMHYLRPNAIVFDTVYNPEQTLLYKQARERRCRVVSGLDMFVGQAALQFQHFTNRDAPTDVMREQIKRAIGPAKY